MFGETRNDAAVEFDRAGEAALVAGEPEDRTGEHGFARARFADERVDFGRRDVDVDAMEDLDAAEGNVKVANLEQRRTLRCIRWFGSHGEGSLLGA